MATRSIIVVTGPTKATRLYKHCDGYPSGNLPIIAAALRTAERYRKERNRDCPQYARETIPRAATVVGLLIGESTSAYGMGAEIEWTCDATSSDRFGDQSDLEWIYEIQTAERNVNVFGGKYAGDAAREVVQNGTVDPLSYCDGVIHPAFVRVRDEIQKAMNSIKRIGWTINGA